MLISLSPSGARPPLVLLPGLASSAITLAPLGRLFAPDRPCFALEARGLDGLREPLAHVEAMAADHLEILTAAHPTGPVRLAGWSLGGLVAFEIAVQLRRSGRDAAVAVLDTLALLPETAIDPAPPPRELHLRRLIEAHRLARARYRPRSFDGPLCLIRAAEAPPEIAASPSLGWDRLARGPFEIHSAPGDHASMLAPPHVAELASVLRSFLDRLDRSEA